MVEVRRRRHACGTRWPTIRSSTSSISASATAARGTSAIRSHGGGDNLFLSSIVALEPDTGEYVWHFQTTPGETWDYTATQHIMLADLTIDGTTRQVVMQAPKNGFFYVLDRVTGEFISAKNYATVTWASGLDPKTGRPSRIPRRAIASRQGRVRHADRPRRAQLVSDVVQPAHRARLHPGAGHRAATYKHDDKFEFRDRTWNTGLSFARCRRERRGAEARPAQSRRGASARRGIPCSSARRGAYVIRRRAATAARCRRRQARVPGSVDGNFIAYAADTGARLWSVRCAERNAWAGR